MTAVVGTAIRALSSIPAIVAFFVASIALAVLVVFRVLPEPALDAAMLLLLGLTCVGVLIALGVILSTARIVALERAEAEEHRKGERKALGFPRDTDYL
jgi:hypothetical protein